jgi:hypothetical protein
MTQACWICDEGYNGEIPCPQCNTTEWNAYHEEHKQIVTVVERGMCTHVRFPIHCQGETGEYWGMHCQACADVVALQPTLQTTAETVE